MRRVRGWVDVSGENGGMRKSGDRAKGAVGRLVNSEV